MSGVAYKPKAGRAPWVAGDVAAGNKKSLVSVISGGFTLGRSGFANTGIGNEKSASAECDRSDRNHGDHKDKKVIPQKDWDSKVAVSLILLIIVINVALAMLLSASPGSLPEAEVASVEGGSNVQILSLGENGAGGAESSRDELLSIVGRR